MSAVEYWLVVGTTVCAMQLCWLQEDLVDVELYEVRDGQSIVMRGAAAQTCCHIVFAPVGSGCFRLRSFWVPV